MWDLLVHRDDKVEAAGIIQEDADERGIEPASENPNLALSA